MVTIDTLEGLINGVLSYHYDVGNDVLYLRLRSAMTKETYGEETEDGDILLRDQATDQSVGLTMVNWWKRFGKGSLPDSIEAIQHHIEPMTDRFAA